MAFFTLKTSLLDGANRPHSLDPPRRSIEEKEGLMKVATGNLEVTGCTG